jgi:Ca2+-transporting ATPase
MPEIPWHALDAQAVLAALRSDPARGLSADEARRRLAEHGPNELAREKRRSAWALFFGQFKNVLIAILLVSIALSALAGETTDALIIAVIVVFCAVLGFVQEWRAERALEALADMLAPTITVLRDGSEAEIAAREIVPGDILLVEAGDKVPADARVVEAHSLRCDEAALTGESAPVGKRVAPQAGSAGLADRRGMVHAGTSVTYGRGRAVVCATGMRTAFGAIAREVARIETGKSPLERRSEEIGKWLGIGALGICFLVAGISVARGYAAGRLDFPFVVTMVMFAISLAVAAVPEALAAIVTGALAVGMRKMAKRNALVRRMPAVETLGCTTVICSDKTGTLTKGEMTVRRVLAGGLSLSVTGAGYEPAGEIRGTSGPAPASEALDLLLLAGLLCNDADLVERDGRITAKGDPSEAALVVLAEKGGLSRAGVRAQNPRLEELPFSSERRRMSTVHDLAPGSAWGGRMALVKGAAETVLGLCAHIHDGREVRPLAEADRQSALEQAEALAGDGLRVLALACRHLGREEALDEETVERGLTFLGLVGMMDPPRPEAAAAVAVCRKVGIRTVMITGDHALTARAVARELDIFREGDLVLEGEELARLSEAELSALVRRVTVYARVSPLDKLKIVRAWKGQGEVVAMTGDGVNDAPALKHADIGVAMGLSGTEVAREAASMVLADDNFASIVAAVELGRWIYDNIKKSLTYLLRCNITEVAVIGGVVLALGPDYLPLLPAAILYINLATDGLPALALGVAPPDPDIMERPPRDPKESVFSREVLAFVGLAVLVEIPFFFFLFFHDLGRDAAGIAQARTELFFLFIAVEMVIALNFRSMRESVFSLRPHGWLLAAVVWEVALAALLIQFEPVREAFGIGVPKAGDIGVILAFGAVVFASLEGIKAWLRRRGRRIDTARARAS